MIDSELGSVSALVMRPRLAESAFVFAHGAGAGMSHAFMTHVAKGLAQRRIATLRFQFPYMQAGKHRVDTPTVAQVTVRSAAAKAVALWPDLRQFAGGKSFGGRMTSLTHSIAPLPTLAGLIFLAFPLHPSDKPSAERAAHLASIDVPVLFIHGSREALAEAAQFEPMIGGLGALATRLEVRVADHALHVPRRTGQTDDQVLEEILDAIAVWTQAWRLVPSPASPGASS